MTEIAIVGSGIVGRATGVGLITRDHNVRFIDIQPAIIQRLIADGLTASTPADTDWNAADITFLCVNTPTIDGHIVLAHLMSAIETLGEGLAGSSKPHTVVVRSTVPPGTTMGLIRAHLERHSGRIVNGRDLSLAVTPEFLRQARVADDFLHPWIHVVGAADDATAERLQSLLAPFGAPVVVTDPKTAETIKYAHNLFNATKISFFNEFWLVCQRMGVDAEVVSQTIVRSAEASWNPAYGSRGGSPYGGACLPKDTQAFLDFAGGLGIDMPLLAATIEVNSMMEAATSPGVPVMASDSNGSSRPVSDYVSVAMRGGASNGHKSPVSHDGVAAGSMAGAETPRSTAHDEARTA